MENLFKTQLQCLSKVGHGCLLKGSIKAESYLDQPQLEQQQLELQPAEQQPAEQQSVEQQQLEQRQQQLPPSKQSNFLNIHILIKRLSNILTVAFVAAAQWPILMYCFYHIDDISLVTAGLSIMFTNLLSVIKISTFLWSKTEFIMIINSFNEMFQKIQNRCATYILKKENKLCGGLVRVYVVSVLCTGLYLMMEPLLKLFWAKIIKGENDAVLELPMCMRFPFVTMTPFNYLVIYCYCGLVTLLVTLYSSAVDGFFMAFTVNLSAHFKVLQNFIMRHPFQYQKSNDIVNEELKLHRDITNFVRYHNLLLRLSTDVCRIYKPIIFGQLFITSLNLCVIVYQLFITGQTESFMNVLIYGTFMLAIILQLFIYCYGGEIVSNESLMCSTAIQLSNWYTLSPSQRLMIFMMLIRSQRAVVIRGFFYDANLATFMMILKATVSYIALIRSIE